MMSSSTLGPQTSLAVVGRIKEEDTEKGVPERLKSVQGNMM